MLLVGILQVGCFSHDEEIWLEADGSGRCRVDLFIATPSQSPELDFELALSEEEVEAVMGDALEEFLVSFRRGLRVQMTYRFESGQSFALPIGATTERITPPAWEPDGWLQRRFEKSVKPPAELGAIPILPSGLGEPGRPGFRYRVTVHFPGVVVDSNASEVDGRTAVWDLAPSAILGGGRVLTARVDRGRAALMRGVWLGGTALLLALLGGAVLVGVMVLKRRAAS